MDRLKRKNIEEANKRLEEFYLKRNRFLNEEKNGLEDDIKKIIKDLESNINKSSEYQDQAVNVLMNYQKSGGYDRELFTKASKLVKKSTIVSWFEVLKKKIRNKDLIPNFQKIFNEYVNDDVDEFDDVGVMQKSLLLDMASTYVSKERNKPWKELFINLVNTYNPKERNDTKIAEKMLSLDMMTVVASKPDNIKHKEEFNKLFYKYLNNGNTSEFMESVYGLANKLKK